MIVLTVLQDSWLARSIVGMEVSDSSLSRHGDAGCCAGYDGIRWHGKANPEVLRLGVLYRN